MRTNERQTERLICRAPRARDVRAYTALFLDPAVAAALFPPPLHPYRRREAAKLLRADIEHWDRHGFGPWALTDRSTGGFVGRGGLAWTEVEGRRVVELPGTILSSRWGTGLATEAGPGAPGPGAGARPSEGGSVWAPPQKG